MQACAQLPLLSYRPNMLGKTRLAAGMEEKKVATVTATTNARTGITIHAIPDPEVENRIESRRPVFLKVHPIRILLNIAIIECSYFRNSSTGCLEHWPSLRPPQATTRSVETSLRLWSPLAQTLLKVFFAAPARLRHRDCREAVGYGKQNIRAPSMS